jgi:hypothetical protein
MVTTTLERADESYYWNTLKDTHGGDVDSAFKFNSGSTPGHMHPFSVNTGPESQALEPGWPQHQLCFNNFNITRTATGVTL